MFDFHLHSNFSADCDTPMEEMVQAAIQKGIQEMCFTEHIDEDYPDETIDFDLDVVNYAATIATMQRKYGDKINIRKGVELGVQPHVLDSYRKLLQKETFDFVICSMHTTKKLDLHSGRFFEGKSLDQAYEEYYLELLECIRTFRSFSVLGHLDLVARYKYTEGVSLFLNIIEEIFKEIIPSGQGIEINTSGFYYGMNRLLPSEDILQLYKDMGGEIITIGSDAHRPDRLAEYYEKSAGLLKKIGFRYVTTFENQQPIFHKL
ncbi:histidinol-phosphatase HisJ family protein [Caldibacillus lycopersici]|uniref:Histidinol-phosphatase n=1 Tax=Perspicuibacillus lycopersici TaxID=1325689 RepID=A0AAE3LND6_9BACI|nr:histidinol-phosphatase HisJ family protein [Perspicuibacillus lycopersici]MCU9613796.1 histidinol-phosphatase HisJ family protein [Perspicuibacillus lycopersici]